MDFSYHHFKHLTPNEKNAGLREAAAFGQIETLQQLIDVHADLNAQDSLGRTALMWAVIYKQIEAASILIKAGANLSTADNNGRNALMLAEECLQNVLFSDDEYAYAELASMLRQATELAIRSAEPVIFSKNALAPADQNAPKENLRSRACSIF